MNSLTTQIKATRTYPVAIAILAALLLVTVFGGSGAKAFPSGAHLYSDAWAGQPSGLLSSPYDAAVDQANNRVYVMDTGNNRVQVFNTDGVYQFQFGSYGSGNGEFNIARGIAFNSGRVFVADGGNNRIQVFTGDGQFLYKFGSSGNGAMQFNNPIGVAATGNPALIYVADTNNHRVSTFYEGGPCGSNCVDPLGTVGGTGSGDGQFLQPFGVDITYETSDGVCPGDYAVMYVADYGNSRVQKFKANPCFLPNLASQYELKWANPGQPFKTKVGPNGNIYTATSVGTPISVRTPNGVAVTSWGTAGTGDGQFRFARGLGVSSTQVFVADGNNNRIQRFSPTGTFQTKWGISQNGDGEFAGPNDVAQDSAGNIYVVDTNNSRVQKFNSSGRLLTKWGTEGTGDGQFNNPLGIGVDSTDTVWVMDTGNNRVQKFNTSGVFQSKFGTFGNGNSQFNGPRDVAFIGTSTYVVDGGNNRIQAFNTSTNAYITQWGGTGSGNGQFSFANSIASAGAYLYVSDNNRVQKFNFGGTYVTSISITSPVGVAWANDELVVVKSGSGTIVNYLAPNSSPTVISSPYEACSTGDGNGELSSPQGVSLFGGTSTTMYIADAGNNRIVKNTISGLHIGTDPTDCGTNGALGNSQFTSPQQVATNANGDIFVADFGANRVVRYDSTGAAISRWGMGGGSDGFIQPTGIGVGADGNVAVADTNTLRRFSNVGAQLNSVSIPGGTRDVAVGSGNDVYRLTSTGVTRYNSSLVSQGSWGSSGSGNGQFSAAQGIATDSAGNVYVADTGNNRIQKFTSTGTYVSQIATTSPFDVAVGPGDERIYALKLSSPAGIRTYTQGGTAIESFGSTGAGVGQFSSPYGIAVTPGGRVAVGDTGNARVQLFDFTNSRTLYDSKITDYGGNELTVPAIPSTTVTGGF